MHSHIYVKLGNIKILYKSKFINIKEHSYYIALKNKNKELYENFILNLNNGQIKKPSGNWEGIQSLLTSIKKDGFDIYNGPFRLVSSNNQIYSRHGRHRLCILL